MRTVNYTRGSNQYTKDVRVWGLKHKTWVTLLWITLFVFFACQVFFRLAQAERPLISPIAMAAHAYYEDEHSTLRIDTPQKAQIVAYVKEVFGTHADKAFKVIACENSSLNPKAVNTAGNFPEGSKDVGIFQINNHWQGVRNEAFLTDYKINVLMAWNIYSRDGYSFKLWTCGRKLGI